MNNSEPIPYFEEGKLAGWFQSLGANRFLLFNPEFTNVIETFNVPKEWKWCLQEHVTHEPENSIIDIQRQTEFFKNLIGIKD